LRENPRDARALGFLGLVLHKQGRLKEAIRSLEHALEIDPGLEGGKEALVQFRAERSQMADRALFWKRSYQWRLPIAVALGMIGIYLLIPAVREAVPLLVYLPLVAAVGVAAFFAGRRVGEELSARSSRKPAELHAESWGSPDGVEKMLREHMARLATLFQGRPGEREAQAFLDEALAADLLAYAVDAISRKLPDAMSSGTIQHESRSFSGWFVAVMACPWLLPEEVKPHLEGGYLRLITDISGPAINAPGGKNVVHWIYCYNGRQAAAHVSLLSNPQAPSRVPAVVAQDFLTAEERRQVGLPPAG
jgi:hypothetical protein